MEHAIAARRLAYRPDIDGLRALAVLSVVVYHAFPTLMPGGFVGVDVFFVISGYLISAIIIDDRREDRFRIARFYAHRVRRIVPALSLVLAACLIAGWWLMAPGRYRDLGQHALASVAFVSNALLYLQTGYFDETAVLKPLLHLWSLALEEQFYLVWPALLLLTWRWRSGPAWLIGVGGAASLLACLWLMPHDPAAAFYSPLTRIWELLAGAALAYWRPAATVDTIGGTRLAGLVAMLGLSLFAASLWTLDAVSRFPAPWALLPVLAAVLLIAGGPASWINRRLLSQPLLVGIGKISYPLYLWHWPLLSFAQIMSPAGVSPATRVLLLVASGVLAVTTYRVIERPLRTASLRRQVVWPLAGLGVVLAMAVAVTTTRGFDGRVGEGAQRYVDFVYEAAEGARAGSCWLRLEEEAPTEFAPECVDPPRADAEPLVVVWGDSHAARFYVGLRAISAGHFRLAQFTRDGCRPFLDGGIGSCDPGNSAVLSRIARLRPDTVILFSWWNAPSLPDAQAVATQISRTARALRASGVGRVIVVGPAPQWLGRSQALPQQLVALHAVHPYSEAPRRMRFGLDPTAARRDADLKRLLARTPNVEYFSSYDALCNADGCLTRLGDDPDALTAFDYAHLTRVGATYVADALYTASRDFARNQEPRVPQDGVTGEAVAP